MSCSRGLEKLGKDWTCYDVSVDAKMGRVRTPWTFRALRGPAAGGPQSRSAAAASSEDLEADSSHDQEYVDTFDRRSAA